MNVGRTRAGKCWQAAVQNHSKLAEESVFREKAVSVCCVCSCYNRLGRIRCSLSWLTAWGLVCVLLFLHCWSPLVGWLSVLQCAFWAFLLLFALLHLFPLFRLFVTDWGAEERRFSCCVCSYAQLGWSGDLHGQVGCYKEM